MYARRVATADGASGDAHLICHSSAPLSRTRTQSLKRHFDLHPHNQSEPSPNPVDTDRTFDTDCPTVSSFGFEGDARRATNGVFKM